ncbi:MAG: hypothetical protein ABI632_01065 [Pseudolysinimonas sp.]
MPRVSTTSFVHGRALGPDPQRASVIVSVVGIWVVLVRMGDRVVRVGVAMANAVQHRPGVTMLVLS